MVKLLDIPETITYSLSNVKLILVTNNYFVEINEVIKGLSCNIAIQRHLYIIDTCALILKGISRVMDPYQSFH